ncbi:MAG: cytochrome c [Micropepsaceae bacterium]
MRIVLLAAIAVALTACISTLDTPPSNPAGLINQRVAVMKGFAGALGAAGAFAQGKGTEAAAHTKLAAAYANTAKLAELFPRGTAMGDRGASTSRALSTIFTNRSDFDAKIEATARALGALDALVQRGAKGEVARTLESAKATCGSCHSKYRAADE